MGAVKRGWKDLTGASSAEKASKAQVKASEQAQATQWKMYEQSRADMAPWRVAGEKALGTLEGMVEAGPGDYTESPGYQFRLDEGRKQIQQGRGNIRSGATEKALQRYSQDYATGDYQNFLNRYYQSLTPFQNLSGTGQQSAAGQAQVAQQTGQTVGNLQQQAGAAKASGYTNKYNAYKGFIGGAAKIGALAYGAGMFGGGGAGGIGAAGGSAGAGGFSSAMSPGFNVVAM